MGGFGGVRNVNGRMRTARRLISMDMMGEFSHAVVFLEWRFFFSFFLSQYVKTLVLMYTVEQRFLISQSMYVQAAERKMIPTSRPFRLRARHNHDAVSGEALDVLLVCSGRVGNPVEGFEEVAQ